MSLPVALGSKSVTSLRLDPPAPHPDETEDGISLEPVVLHQTVAVCACPHHEWFVQAAIAYYDLCSPIPSSSSDRHAATAAAVVVERTMAEIRIQVTPMHHGLMSLKPTTRYHDYRETVHRVRLPRARAENGDDGDHEGEGEGEGGSSDFGDSWPPEPCSVHVSTDRRHVACLLSPISGKSEPLVVVFQLRIPRKHPSASALALGALPLPSYLRTSGTSSSDGGAMKSGDYQTFKPIGSEHEQIDIVDPSRCSVPKSPVVATNPRALVDVPNVTAMATYSRISQANDSGSAAQSPTSCLVLASQGGRLYWAEYRSGWAIPTADLGLPGSVVINQLEIAQHSGMVIDSNEIREIGNLVACDSECVAHVAQWQLETLVGKQQLRATVTLLRKISDVTSTRFLLSHAFAVLYRPSAVITDRGGMCAAQVWCCGTDADDAGRQAKRTATWRNSGVQPISSFEPTCDQMEDLVVHRTEKEEKTKSHLDGSGLMGHFGIEYDRRTGCLCLSTVYHATAESLVSGNHFTLKRVACVWNWRANVVGLVWTFPTPSEKSIRSQLWFGKDRHQGRFFVHVEAFQSTPILMRKQTIRGGILSPRSCRMISSLSEPSSILLSYDSVAFPIIRRTSAAKNTQLHWAESNIPSDYISSYGPPQLAAFGCIRGSSLAVSSSRGLCLLDIAAQKWRMFGSESEERAFQVIAMRWWEGTKSKDLISHSEDLLVSVIRHSGLYYLSCWSLRRLDLIHQLLKTNVETDSNFATGNSWGILLPHHAPPSSLSLISEPKSDKRRCVVLVSGNNCDSGDVEYMALQLQTVSRKAQNLPETYAEQQPYHVYAQIASKGTIKSTPQQNGSLSSVFLASASFRFNLNSDEEITELGGSDGLVAVLGIVRTPGGLESLLVSRKGVSLRSMVVGHLVVSRYWLADVITCGCRQRGSPIGPNAYIWAVESSGGKLTCWSVPYYCEHQSKSFNWYCSGNDLLSSNAMSPVHNPDVGTASIGCYLGVVCCVGKSSDFMQRSSATNNSDLPLNCVPRSPFGCILGSGQQKRRAHGSSEESVGPGEISAVDLSHDIFSPTDYSLMPPAFLPSLFTMLQEAATLRATGFSKAEFTTDESSESVTSSERIAAIEDHVQYRLSSIPNSDTVMMALRLLIINTVNALSSSYKKLSKSQSDQSPEDFVHQMHLFSEVVDAIRLYTTDLQFASLFLEVGRQLEPSGFLHLFPLPLSIGTYRDDRMADDAVGDYGSEATMTINKFNARTVPDMITLSISQKSLLTSASALSLLGSKRKSKSYCEQMLRYAMNRIVTNISSPLAAGLHDTTVEERRILGDMFHYGTKLEDAFITAELARHQTLSTNPNDDDGVDEIDGDANRQGNAGATSYSTSECDTSDDEDEDVEIPRPGLLCGQNTILTMIVPGVFGGSQAVSTQAHSKSTPDPYGIQPKGDGDSKSAAKEHVEVLHDTELHSHYGETEGVAVTIGRVIVQLLVSVDLSFQWRAIAAFARLLPLNIDSGDGELSLLEMIGFIAVDDLEAIVPPSYQQDSLVEDAIVEFLITGMSRCSHEVQSDEARTIYDLSMLLLQRLFRFRQLTMTLGGGVDLREHSEVANIRTGLILLCLVSGFTSDRIEPIEITDASGEPPALLVCYKRSLDAFALSV